MTTNYIISGGEGFIGTNLADKIPEDDSLTILDKKLGYDLCIKPIKVSHCDTFIHLAAITNVRDSLQHPKKVILDNCSMTLRCLDYVRAQGSHFVFSSSMGAPELLSPYSASKLACEEFITTYRKTYNVKATILRLSNVYGPYSMHKTSVVAKFIKQCIDHGPLEIYGNGLQTRDFVYIDDVVSTIIKCRMRLVNVASGASTAVSELAETIRHISMKFLNYRPEIVYLDAIKGEITEINPLTDIRPATTLYKGLTTTFKWFMDNYHAK